VAGLALVAFTLVLTVFSIMEPLRKQGLATGQVFALFTLTVPVMLSFTLPVATLFAATIVYGRFSQDNELLASNASGISTISLLKPVLVMGGIVTAFSLILSNFVAPQLASLGEKAIKANVSGIIYHQLQSQNYVKFKNYLLHADHVNSDTDMLRGVVAIDTKRPGDVRVVAASTAWVKFKTNKENETYASISLMNPAGGQTGRWEISKMGSTTIESPPMPSLSEEKAAFYDWGRLLRTLREPSRHAEIHRELIRIKRDLSHDILIKDVAAAINSGREYAKLQRGNQKFIIKAAAAEVGFDGSVILRSSQLDTGELQGVEVTILEKGKESLRILAKSGTVRGAWSRLAEISYASILLEGEVEVHNIMDGLSDGDPQRPGEWQRGEIPFPASVAAKTHEIDLDEIYDRGPDTENPNILQKIKDLKEHRISKIVGEILAEIHLRLAYSLSCFLLVAMGSALGVIFRGGQFISAFAISVVPAAIVIILMIMGKQMIVNPDVPIVAGLAAIWGGIIALIIANGFIYAHLMRK